SLTRASAQLVDSLPSGPPSITAWWRGSKPGETTAFKLSVSDPTEAHVEMNPALGAPVVLRYRKIGPSPGTGSVPVRSRPPGLRSSVERTWVTPPAESRGRRRGHGSRRIIADNRIRRLWASES